MDEEIVDKKSILQRIIDTIAKLFSIKQKKTKRKKNTKTIFIQCGNYCLKNAIYLTKTI